MKRKLLPILLASAIIAGACNPSSDSSSQHGEVRQNSAKSLRFSMKEFKKETKLRCNPCPEVYVVVPVATADTLVAERINKAVFEAVHKVLGQEGKKATGYDDLLTGFIGQYEHLVETFPDHAGAAGWTGTVSGSIVRQDSVLVNLKLETYTMTGGAHGYGSKLSLLFDPATGERYTVPELVRDTVTLNTVAEASFREKFAIPAGKPINSTGFTFENDRFVLPQNIFFTKEGLLLHYNAYEIAPYSQGASELLLPYGKVAGSLAGKL